MDIIYINDLKIETIVGVFDWEREIKQTVSIDVEMAWDIRKAAKTDDLQYALDYKAVGKRIIAFVENSEFYLVETLAERVAEIILQEFNVSKLKLRLSKPGALRGSKDAGVVIERGQVGGKPGSINEVYLGIGSNLDREKNIKHALSSLEKKFDVIALSPVYESKSFGFSGEDFYNLVIKVETEKTLNELDSLLKEIENQTGRARGGEKFSDRTLDIDVLCYGDLCGNFDGVELPRDEVFKCAFVLKPFQDIAGDKILAGQKKNLRHLWEEFDKSTQPLKKVHLTF